MPLRQTIALFVGARRSRGGSYIARRPGRMLLWPQLALGLNSHLARRILLWPHCIRTPWLTSLALLPRRGCESRRGPNIDID
eukprot:2823137-Pyramimonas_sp.AAC.1